MLLLSLRRTASRLSEVASGSSSAARSATSSTACSASPGWLRGGVVDFIDFQWFPIFNVADMAITIGGVLLVILASYRASPSRTDAAPASPTVEAT